MKVLDSFTVEEIEEIISTCQQEIHNTPTSDEFPVSPRVLLSLARIALAAKRAEPCGYAHKNAIKFDLHDTCRLHEQAGDENFIALYTTPQLNSPEIPDGWKLVPIEPTDAMQVAAANAIRFDTTAINKLWTGKRVFDAMLPAAPEKPL